MVKLLSLLASLVCLGCLRADPIFPDPGLASEDVIAAKPGMTIYQTKNKAAYEGKFGVCIPSTYSPDQPMRLIVSSHGIPDISLTKWRNRPIYIFWGEKDLPNIPGEGEAMLNFVEKTLHNTKLKHEVIPNGHHDSRPDLVAKWFAGLTDDDFQPDPTTFH